MHTWYSKLGIIILVYWQVL